ncbi:HD domain-containing protein, partial [candidate division WOR-3 bacterium]|nr:HD domain-containing protein [candidate division WOR-3 bacterium]
MNRLAPFACFSAKTQGREFAIPHSKYRTEFQRDRDRILHSQAFRKLEYKTQVFVNHEADYYRTRLTHTLEVASIGRSIAKSLKANEDLTEAIAFAHDIGHTPFGHAGEMALHDIM